MKRDEAETLVRQYIKNERLINHCLASEAVMRAMAGKLGEDMEKWGLAGLIHDLDVELTGADPHTHTHETARILREKGVDPEIIEAVELHNEAAHDKRRSTTFQHALAAGETITGLIVATTLVYPDKKLASVKPKSVLKRMKEKSFAASVNRDTIRECEKAGIPLEEFVVISLEAMRGISNKIGL